MNNRKKKAMRTILLECPRCRNALSGWPVDRLFFCDRCRIAVDFREDPAMVIPVRYSVLQNTEKKPVWLPVWHLEVNVTVEGSDRQSLETARESRPDEIWIFGFFVLRMNMYGNAHAEFSRLKPAFHTDGPAQVVRGCQIQKMHVLMLADTIVKAMIDQSQDVSDLQISTLVRSVDLLAIPFFVEEKTLFNPDTSFRFNRASIGINRWLDSGHEELLS